MRPFRVSDLKWTWGGDLALNHQGDLGYTSDNALRSFLQEVRTRLQSELYDWKLQPHIGASMVDLIGEPNNKETAELGRTKIIASLVKDDLVAASSISVKYMPVDQCHILYRITLTLPGATEQEIVDVSFLLDTEASEITFLDR